MWLWCVCKRISSAVNILGLWILWSKFKCFCSGGIHDQSAYFDRIFNETELNIYSAESLLNSSVPVNLPPLAIADQEYNDALLLDEEASYDLQSLINQTKEQSTMYSSLSQYLYHTLIKANQYNKDFVVFNTLDWLVLLATVPGFLALICSGIVYSVLWRPYWLRYNFVTPWHRRQVYITPFLLPLLLHLIITTDFFNIRRCFLRYFLWT